MTPSRAFGLVVLSLSGIFPPLVSRTAAASVALETTEAVVRYDASPPPQASPQLAPGILKWDRELYETTVRLGAAQAAFAIVATNISNAPIVISNVQVPSGCTVTKAVEMPGTLASGAKGTFEVTMDLTGMRGSVGKILTVTTDRGDCALEIRAHIDEQPVVQVIPPYSPERDKAPNAMASPPAVVPSAAPSLADGILTWNSETQEATVPLGTSQADFQFRVDNVSKETLSISSVHTSCGCTVAKLPATPWALAPGTNGSIDVTMNLAGKRGTIAKTLTVITDHGSKILTVRTVIQDPPAGTMSQSDRVANLQIASANRQVVLQGECASCHAKPAIGKMGAELFSAACMICHETEHRADSVPDLKHLQKPTDADYWRTWITSSKEGKLMPAFAIEHGGILSPAQIDSLVKYLVEAVPSTKSSEPSVAPTLPAP